MSNHDDTERQARERKDIPERARNRILGKPLFNCWHCGMQLYTEQQRTEHRCWEHPMERKR